MDQYLKILAQACLKFREIRLREWNVDPFNDAITIANSYYFAFRRNFLRRNTIGLIPKNGYRLMDTQSAIALQWLSWEEKKRDVRIVHAGRGKEVKLSGWKLTAATVKTFTNSKDGTGTDNLNFPCNADRAIWKRIPHIEPVSQVRKNQIKDSKNLRYPF